MPQASLNPLREALIQKGLPADYIRRTLGELADHLADAETTEAARLGDPRQLAKRFSREYRASTFAGRHPVLSLLLLGLILTHVILIAYYIAVELMIALCALMSGLPIDGNSLLPIGQSSPTLFTTIHVLVALGAFVPFALIAWLAARQVKRMGRGRGAAIGAFAIIALLAGTCGTQIQFPQIWLPPSEYEPSRLVIGYFVPFPDLIAQSPGVLVRPTLQTLAILTCGGLFCRHTFDARHTLPEIAED